MTPRTIFLRLLSAIVLAVVGSGVLPANLFYFLFSPLTVYLSYGLLSLVHGSVTLDGHVIMVGSQAVELIPACVAASAYLLLALLILLTRGISLRKGMLMFVVGSVLILIANVLRIEILTSLLLTKQVNYFETLHLLIWKVMSSAYVVVVWIVLCKLFSVKTIPVYSDLQHLIKK